MSVREIVTPESPTAWAYQYDKTPTQVTCWDDTDCRAVVCVVAAPADEVPTAYWIDTREDLDKVMRATARCAILFFRVPRIAITPALIGEELDDGEFDQDD